MRGLVQAVIMLVEVVRESIEALGVFVEAVRVNRSCEIVLVGGWNRQ